MKTISQPPCENHRSICLPQTTENLLLVRLSANKKKKKKKKGHQKRKGHQKKKNKGTPFCWCPSSPFLFLVFRRI